MSFKFLVSLCENGGMRCDSEILVFLGVNPLSILWQMVCISIRKRIGVVWTIRSTSFQLIARLLDFEEKWETKFQCEVQAWVEGL